MRSSEGLLLQYSYNGQKKSIAFGYVCVYDFPVEMSNK